MEGWLPASYFLERGVMCNFDVGGDDGDDGGVLLLYHVHCYMKVEHKGLTGEIKLKDGMRTEFQLDVMDKVRLTSYVLFRQREKSI